MEKIDLHKAAVQPLLEKIEKAHTDQEKNEIIGLILGSAGTVVVNRMNPFWTYVLEHISNAATEQQIRDIVEEAMSHDLGNE